VSNYTKATNFATKDALLTGNPAKIIKGTEIDDEYNAIAVAVATKADTVSPTFTGTPLAPTAAGGTNTTQVATTAFVTAADTAERTATATLTNKTLTSPTINTATITGGSISGITDLAVVDGGTGVSALTADNVILGDGTNPVKFVAPGSTGNLLTSNGTTWTSAAPAAGGVTSFNTRTGAVTLTTSDVLTAEAGATAGAIGTYAFLYHTTDADYNFDDTLAGSSLAPAGIAVRNWRTYTAASASSQQVVGVTNGNTQSGTWRCMGVGSNIQSDCNNNRTASLWLRIS
jgi:hypothetical protein